MHDHSHHGKHRHEHSDNTSTAPDPHPEVTEHAKNGKGRALYFDCVGGISGNMCLGALIDLGCPLDYLLGELARLGMSDKYELVAESKKIHGINGTHVAVNLTQAEHHGRHLADILAIIEAGEFDDSVTASASRIFKLLAEAESAVHGMTLESIHFHEVGAVDAIVDIVGTCIAINYFSPDAVYCSPMRTGKGIVQCMHGAIPVPAPAVLRLAQGRTMEYLDMDGEATTPTGAAVLAGVAEEVATLKITIQRVGYGCGTREFEGLPNILRIVQGIVQ